MGVTFEQLRQHAALMLEKPLSFSKEDFIKLVEEYVEGLPEWRKDALLGYKVPGKVVAVRYRDLPRVLREDEEFFRRYVRALAEEGV